MINANVILNDKQRTIKQRTIKRMINANVILNGKQKTIKRMIIHRLKTNK